MNREQRHLRLARLETQRKARTPTAPPVPYWSPEHRCWMEERGGGFHVPSAVSVGDWEIAARKHMATLTGQS